MGKCDLEHLIHAKRGVLQNYGTVTEFCQILSNLPTARPLAVHWADGLHYSGSPLMNTTACLASLVLLASLSACQAESARTAPAAEANTPRQDILDHSYRPLAGTDAVNLRQTYGGKVLLVVNTASKCGFTPQFDGLEALHAQYHAQGFSVLGFSSGDFREQEFGDENEILEFCRLTYGVQFPMFEKVHVIGDDATGLYQDLYAATHQAPQWNFHKYLIGRDGEVIGQWPSRVTPDSPELVEAIETALTTSQPGT